MDISTRSVITPPAKLSRQHSPESFNGTSTQIATTPPARLIRQQSPRSVTSASASMTPVKPSRPNSPRISENIDTEHALQDAGNCNENHSQICHSGHASIFEDVTIPINILRYANIAEEWTPDAEVTGTQYRHQADSTSAFNVVDIALEQQLVIDYALSNAATTHAGFSSRTMSVWDNTQARKWRQTSLPTRAEEKTREALVPQRRSTSGMRVAHQTPRKSIDMRQGQDHTSAGQHMDNTILFRSLNSYALNEAAGKRERKYSDVIPPDVDYLVAYEGSMEKDIARSHSEDPSCVAKDEPE
jgi:hypothetical protein